MTEPGPGEWTIWHDLPAAARASIELNAPGMKWRLLALRYGSVVRINTGIPARHRRAVFAQAHLAALEAGMQSVDAVRHAAQLAGTTERTGWRYLNRPQN